ncbi:ABC transporter permease [Streptantibioticus ferralitis]|uniref:ABC transporter permease n=1 Tax=Streptantibioticus ferralitis TaxID=236510 RepID=A0ABT5Z6N3_9ACTN|nr:ABC transporter permease [Streptantibioticus ferralitis]MDF2259491.1 ABC transporter permease [Streptantibioticus ferralitis]
MDVVEGRYSTVTDISRAYGLTPEQHRAVEDAYGAYSEHLSPFITAVAADMLKDLRQDVANDPGRRIVFLGRDGHSLAAAVRGLDPEFAERHCHEVVLSRAVVDAALQDLERNAGMSFPQVESFRVRDKVNADEIDHSHLDLTDYLRASGVPVGLPDSSVTLVDTSFKGTVQEMLAAAYPQTEFNGRYAFFGASPDDPHPGTKRGYAFHREVDDRWQGIPLSQIPDEVELTFGANDGISVIENTLNGPYDSPTAITSSGPQQQPLRNESQPLAGLNPARVPEQYRDPVVREAVKTAGLLATHHTAAAVAQRGGTPPGLAEARDRLAGQIRAWVDQRPGVDPRLGRLLDGFVRLRADSRINKALDKAMVNARIPPKAAEQLWGRLASLPTVEDRQAFAEDVVNTLKTTQAEMRGAAGRRGATPQKDGPAPTRPRRLGREGGVEY